MLHFMVALCSLCVQFQHEEGAKLSLLSNEIVETDCCFCGELSECQLYSMDLESMNNTDISNPQNINVDYTPPVD